MDPMLRKVTYSFLLLILTVLFSGKVFAFSGSAGLDRIERAMVSGELSQELGTLYKVYSIRSPEKIPQAYRPSQEIIGRCATPIIKEAIESAPGFSPQIQAAISEALDRPVRTYTYDSPAGYFKIHYDLSGLHAVPAEDIDENGVPDFIERIALYADSSWQFEIYTQGFRAPPSDNGDGGDDLYDIYTEAMGYYGYCQPEDPGPEPWNDYTSFISVHKNFINFPPNDDPEGNEIGAAKVTVAHEFNHACQFAYDRFDETFFYELTATYMEDEVFDEVNDNYNYLDEFFDSPHTSLKENSFHMYSTFIFGRFLRLRYGPGIMPVTWDYIRYYGAGESVDSALTVFGSSFAEQFPEFTSWNYFTGTRDDGLHYDEGANYPQLPIYFDESVYPVERNQTSSTRPKGWAANYALFNKDGTPGPILKVDFNGQDYAEWAVSITPIDADGNGKTTYHADIDQITGNGMIYVPLFSGVDYALGVISNLNESASLGANYVYTAEMLSPGDVNEDQEITPLDVTVLVNYVYRYGTGIEPHDSFGDCNCDGNIDPVDVLVLVNYVFRQSFAPCTM